MNRTTRICLVAVVGIAIAAALGTRKLVPESGGAPALPAAILSEPMITRALSSAVPARPTMTDEIRHFRARLAARNGEAFARRRLVAALLLRFRAYANPADLQAAEAEMTALEADAHASPALLSARAALLLTQHRFAEAGAASSEAVRRSGVHDGALILRQFDALWAVGEYAQAASLLDLRHDTTSTDVLARQARVLDRQGYSERARDNFRAILRRVRAYAQPPAIEAWALVELGHLEQHTGDPVRAVQHYMEALDILPGSPAALEGLAGVAYKIDGNLVGASRLYERALENGAHLDLLPVLAEVEERRGHHDRARTLRNEFIARATADERTRRLYLRPLVHLLARDSMSLDKALELAQLDLEDRKDPGAWDALALVLFRMGNIQAAYHASLNATAWGVPEPDIAFRSARIADAIGAADRARRLWRIAAAGIGELSPADAEVVRQRLDAPG